MSNQLSHILLALGGGLSACGTTPIVSDTDGEAAFEDPCLQNDQTERTRVALATQGFVEVGPHRQEVVGSSFGSTRYWRQVTGYRYKHPDGRIQYATCRGAIGPQYPIGQTTTLPTSMILATNRLFGANALGYTYEYRGRGDTLTLTVQDFELGGTVGWDPIARYVLKVGRDAPLALTDIADSGMTVDGLPLTVGIAPTGKAAYIRLGAPNELRGYYEADHLVTPLQRMPWATLAVCNSVAYESDGVYLRYNNRYFGLKDAFYATSQHAEGWVLVGGADDPDRTYVRPQAIFYTKPTARIEHGGHRCMPTSSMELQHAVFERIANRNLMPAAPAPAIDLVDIGPATGVAVKQGTTIAIDPGRPIMVTNASSFTVQLTGAMAPANAELASREQLAITAQPGGYMIISYPGGEAIHVNFVAR